MIKVQIPPFEKVSTKPLFGLIQLVHVGQKRHYSFYRVWQGRLSKELFFLSKLWPLNIGGGIQ
jgi:hypothetical protein